MSSKKAMIHSPQYFDCFSTADQSLLPSITGSPIRAGKSVSHRSPQPHADSGRRNHFVPRLHARIARHRTVLFKEAAGKCAPSAVPTVVGTHISLGAIARSRSVVTKPHVVWKLSPMPSTVATQMRPRPPSRSRCSRPTPRNHSLMVLGSPERKPTHAVSTYHRELSSLRFDLCTLPSCPTAPVNIRRISAEMKSLGADLPCDPTAAIFVRGDPVCLSHFQAMVSGVQGTPYAHGLYLFDIQLPENYPNSPPKVTLLTTGGGSVRFNPNLYDTGYVCLSIINTWSGLADESWNPGVSSIYQVLLSLQSLVMTADIAKNEPGFELLRESSSENKAYTAVVRFANMRYAIADVIVNPPSGFEEVVRKHFTIKKDEIVRDIYHWTNEVPPNKFTFGAVRLTEAHNPSVLRLFARLGVKGSLLKAASEVTNALAIL